MPAPKPTPRIRLHLAEWLCLWVMLFALGGFISYSEYLNYRQVDTSERSRLASQALVIEKNLAAQLFSADRALQALRMELGAGDGPSKHAGMGPLDERLKLISDMLTGISTVFVTNASGTIIHANVASLVGFDASGRDYFQQALKQRKPDTLFVTAPFTSALGKTSISLVREITGAHGEFGGVVLAALDPVFFAVLLDSVRFTPDTNATLVHGDGKLFVFEPANAVPERKDLAVPGSFFTQHKASGRPTNLFAGVTYLTGEAKLIAFQTVQPPELTMDKTLVVTVSRDASAIHADWRRQATLMAWMYAGLCLMVCSAMFFYQQRRRVFQRLTLAKESALRASDARLRSFFEATPDALLISDSNGTITMANQQVERLLGYSIEELIGKSVDELVPASARGKHPKMRHDYTATPSARRMGPGMAVKALRKDGTQCDVEVSLSRIETHEGAFFASAMRDITERTLAMEALQASDAFSVSILDSVAASVAVTNRAGVIVRVNQAWLNFALENSLESGQLPAGTGVGSNYFSVCTGSSEASCSSDLATQRGMQQVLDGSVPSFALEYPCHSPTRQRWFMMNVTPLGPQARYGLVISHTDISQLKATQEQLRIAAVAFESDVPMLIANSQGGVLQANRAFVASTGFAADDIVGQTPHMLQSGRHDPAFYRSMWRVIQRTGKWQGEIWDRRKNGEIYPKWLTISAVKADDGSVTHYVGTHQDSTERLRATERIRDLAFNDQLTGLPNRTLLADRLKQTLTASSRSGVCGALLFIDLDHFKTLNDTQGHDIGDLQLKQVAARLSTCVREGDTVARVGGDEFVVILAGLSKSEIDAATDTEVVATKILAVLNQPYSLGELTHISSASIGATLFQGTRASIDELMKQADMAMYRAKGAGRNAVRFFDPSMETAVVKRMTMQNDLRLAMEGKQFVLHYQSQVEGVGCVTGAEVLLRWHHPTRGMVSPADFIPLAEETGLILALGQWVLETTCLQLESWGREPCTQHLTLAVNVSALQFAQCDFVEQVMAVVQRTGANPLRLKLELTESLLVGDVVEIIEKMESLKASGIGFSLDDFGTGYSSLAYLSRLPLDQLKIDKSFVNDVVTNPDDAAIARTIIALAHSLRLGVIAEGVETDAQRKFLASAGCHAYQGYFFSRPLPLEGFEALVRRASLSTTELAI